ncbi:MAG: cysteine desulfurase [Ignavibacteriae bacterium]|nr:cysteine desulfurase [Ignavibacteriota bacterium]MCB9244261.1 cysteine desulfurase [Ignavibacteriales bacterium]
MKKIYLDSAATTMPAEDAISEMMPYFTEKYGNASSIHGFGKPAKVALEDARDIVAEFMGAKPKEIFFTSGGTESNNFALKGIAFAHLGSDKNHIITSSIEHMAVLETMKYLRDRFGFDVTFISPEIDGSISPDKINEAVTDRTFLISIMHSNNETGKINDISLISQNASGKGIDTHTDSIQSFGKIKGLSVRSLGVNTATLSAHKIYGPKGVSALYIKEGTKLDKFIHGGSQERDMRGGTENIPAIVGFRKAVEILNERMDQDLLHYNNLKTHLVARLSNELDEKIIFNSDSVDVLPNIVNFSLNPELTSLDGEELLIKLDLKGISVSGGSACTSGTLKPSHVITALGRNEKTALLTVRVSFSRYNILPEIDYFVDVLKEII